MKCFRYSGKLFVLCVIALFSAISHASKPDFDTLLKEAGLTLAAPDSFLNTEVRENSIFPYEYALEKNKSIEVRYAIRPLARISIDYEDPHNAAPEPNHIFTMMFNALIGQLSRNGNSPHREFQSQEALERFNADWAAMSLLDIEPAFSSGYDQAFLLAIHKNNLSDAYLIILFNDYESVREELDQIMSSLRFN